MRWLFHRIPLKGTFLLLLLVPLCCPGVSAAQEVIRVACIGDSITAGFGIPKDRQTYPQHLQEKLGPGYLVENFGASGFALQKLSNAPYLKTKQWQRALEFLPDIAVVVLGTNDSKPKNFGNTGAFRDDARGLIRELRALSSHPRVLIGLPPPVFKTNFTINEENMMQIRAMLKEVAGGEGVETVDLFTPMEVQSRLFPDGIHPNAEGVAVLAGLVSEAVLQPAKLDLKR